MASSSDMNTDPSKKKLKTRVEEHPSREPHLANSDFANSDPIHAYVRHRSELEAKNEEGQTPLHIACAKDKFLVSDQVLGDSSDVYLDLPLAAELMDSISPSLKRSFQLLPEYTQLCVEYKKQSAFGYFHSQLRKMFVAEKYNEERFIRAYHFLRNHDTKKFKAARKAFCTAKAQNYPSKKNLKTRIEKHPSYKLHLANTDHTHALVRCLAGNKEKFLPGIAKEAANDIARQKLGGILHQTAGMGRVMGLERMLMWPTTELEAKNEKGQTPFHVACVKGMVRCAALLAKAGANLNARDENNDTALHSAARNGNIKLVTLLLECGADVTCKNNKNETPLDLVLLGDHYDEIWKLFQKFVVSDQVLDGSSDMHMDSTTPPPFES